MADTKRVRALVVKTEFIPGYGMVVMNCEGEREESRFPIVPVKAIPDLIAKGLVADDYDQLPQLDHDKDGKAGGSKPKKAKAKPASASADLGDARKRYREVFGKGPGPKWTVEQIEAKIAESQTEGDGDDSDSDGDEADAPPA